MVSTDVENPVYSIKLSSVVPATPTGENRVHELSGMDLVMKLHYLRGVYFFKSNVVQGLTISEVKEPMFTCLVQYCTAAGRIRRSETGRPFIKLNDSGVRIVEAKCNKTLDEWLEIKNHSLHTHLVSTQVLGPELAFSPLVLLQVTWFKCGGLSVGLSWAHVLGDAFSASSFINMWGQFMAGHLQPQSLNLQKTQIKTENSLNSPSVGADPPSVKRVEPVRDYWLTANNRKMETVSFQITANQLNHLQSEICGQSLSAIIPPFESLCAVMWQCLAKIREGSEPRIVTICRNSSHDRENGVPSNNQILSVLEADFSVVEANPSELAALITKCKVDEKSKIEETVERDQGLSDFIVYGANLTFVDLQELKLYGLELKGQKPVLANYTIDGVGNEGAVLVLPGPEHVREEGGGGRTVTVILPENQLAQLKNELKTEWCIA